MSASRRHEEPVAVVPPGVAGEALAPATRPSTFSRWLAWLKSLKGAIVAIASVGAVLGGFAGYWNAYQATRAGSPSASLLATVGTGNAGPLSIVVLPFANLTGDPQQAYLADGLTAAMTADLSRISGAFIVSAGAAFAYKDKPVTLQQVGKDLGVRFALQGGVQRSGDKIRINAQLVDTTSNGQLWSESFEGSQADLFALQDLVTTRVGNSIGREMVVLAARDSEVRKTDPKAADLLLRARAQDLRPRFQKLYEESQALYRQALLLEPRNAEALAGLAASLAAAAYDEFVVDPIAREKQLVEGRDLALKAMDLDPSNPNIYVTLSMYAVGHGDFEGARRADETVLSLRPKTPGAYTNLAASYIEAADPARAIELLTQGISLDPRHVHEATVGNMGQALFMQGDDKAAIEWLLKAQDMNPGNAQTRAFLAMAYARKGDHARARTAVAALLRVEPTFSLSKFEAPKPGQPAAYREFWETTLLAAGRQAGLPE